MEKYNLYIDESGDHSFKSTRWLCLCGIIINENYNNYIENIFCTFKKKYNIEDVVLHLSDIRGNNKKFAFLNTNKNLKTEFLMDLQEVIMKIDFKIIAVVVDKEFLSQKYSNPVEPYHYSLTMLIEILVPYLSSVNGICKVSAESRNGSNLDIPLECHFKKIFDNGTRWGHHGNMKLEAERIQSVIKSKNIKFFNKPSILSNKIHGLEISDLLCSPMMQHIKTKIYDGSLSRPKFERPLIPVFTQKMIIEQVCQNRTIGINWQP